MISGLPSRAENATSSSSEMACRRKSRTPDLAQISHKADMVASGRGAHKSRPLISWAKQPLMARFSIEAKITPRSHCLTFPPPDNHTSSGVIIAGGQILSQGSSLHGLHDPARGTIAVRRVVLVKIMPDDACQRASIESQGTSDSRRLRTVVL